LSSVPGALCRWALARLGRGSGGAPSRGQRLPQPPGLFHVAGAGFSPREVRVNGRLLAGGGYSDNPYRPGGLLVSRRDFGEALDRDENLVEIFV